LNFYHNFQDISKRPIPPWKRKTTGNTKTMLEERSSSVISSDNNVIKKKEVISRVERSLSLGPNAQSRPLLVIKSALDLDNAINLNIANDKEI
jgi:hypothetical protein